MQSGISLDYYAHALMALWVYYTPRDTVLYIHRVYFFGRTSSWYAIMPLTKVCPQCSAIEHCRRSVCTNSDIHLPGAGQHHNIISTRYTSKVHTQILQISILYIILVCYITPRH